VRPILRDALHVELPDALLGLASAGDPGYRQRPMTTASAAAPPLPTAPSDRAPLGPWHAAAAYAVLLLGFFPIGASQGLNVVGGLWATEAVAIALPVFLWLWAARVRPGPLLGLRPLSGKWLGLTALTALLNQPAVTLLEYAAHSLLPHTWVLAFDQKTAFLDTIFRNDFWPMTLTVTLAAPLGEELFFRGFAFPLLARRSGGESGQFNTPLFAALVSGALFSAIHLDSVGFLGLMEIGVWLAVLRWGSGSLYAALLGHALNNGFAAVAFKLGLQDPSEAPPVWMLGLGAVFLSGLCVFGWRVLRAPSPAPPEQRLTPSADGAVRLRRAWPLWLFWAACCASGLLAFARIAAKTAR
jgi:membrane protease YdiL (CAAX protease family)